MKRLLSILGSLGILTTAVVSVVSCGETPSNTLSGKIIFNEKINAVINESLILPEFQTTPIGEEFNQSEKLISLIDQKVFQDSEFAKVLADSNFFLNQEKITGIEPWDGVNDKTKEDKQKMTDDLNSKNLIAGQYFLNVKKENIKLLTNNVESGEGFTNSFTLEFKTTYIIKDGNYLALVNGMLKMKFDFKNLIESSE